MISGWRKETAISRNWSTTAQRVWPAAGEVADHPQHQQHHRAQVLGRGLVGRHLRAHGDRARPEAASTDEAVGRRRRTVVGDGGGQVDGGRRAVGGAVGVEVGLDRRPQRADNLARNGRGRLGAGGDPVRHRSTAVQAAGDERADRPGGAEDGRVDDDVRRREAAGAQVGDQP
jgi:hypothetical protein